MPPPDREHRISLDEAALLTRRLRNLLEPAIPDGGLGGLFKAADVRTLLDQPGCLYLRFYFGRDANNRPVVVLVGADENMNDQTGGTTLENHYPCPPWCPEQGQSALREDPS